MAKILVYSDNTCLAAELLGFAASTGQEVSVLALDEKATSELSSCGAEKVLVAEDTIEMPEACAKSLAEYVKTQGYGLVLIGATPRGRDLGARLAGYLHCGIGSDVSALAYDGSTVTFDRMIYGGSVVSKEQISGLGVVTVARGVYEKVSGAPAEKETVKLEQDARTVLVSREEIKSEGVDIATADHVVGVGMGLSTTDELAVAQELASALFGAVGCSRGIAEERGWVPIERYIGISGKVITPQLYLTLGISGQIQHLYGVRDAKVIAAVDKNENASIFRSADYYIVGDLRELVPFITEAVRAL